MSTAHVLSPVLRTMAVVCGAHVLSYVLTGRGLIARARALVSRVREPEELSPPDDPVDEASWESFPASDPPAISPKPST